jgi:serum/glucocorticoid-regulated kinase 2
LEYCSGGDLFEIVSKLSRLKEEVARFYLGEILLGVEYLHSQNILYRDLKPENILLCEDGHIKITDFGLCKLNIVDEVSTKSFCGSPAYMPPELIEG